MTREENESRFQSFRIQRRIDGLLAIIGVLGGFESDAARKRARDHFKYPIEDQPDGDGLAEMAAESERQIEAGDMVCLRMIDDFNDTKEGEVCAAPRVIADELIAGGWAIPSTRSGFIRWPRAEKPRRKRVGAGLCRQCGGRRNPMYPDSVFLTRFSAMVFNRGWVEIATLLDQRTFRAGEMEATRDLLLKQTARGFEDWWRDHGPRVDETPDEYQRRVAEHFENTPEGKRTRAAEGALISVEPIGG